MNIGIDIGYSSVKARGIKTITFPSAIGTPDRSRFGMSGTTHKIIGTSQYEEFMYGDDAVLKSRIVARREDRDWIGSEDYYKLFLAALYELFGNESQSCNLVTGLPVAFYDDRKRLVETLQQPHEYWVGDQKVLITVENIRVVPQPFGTLIDNTLNEDYKISDVDMVSGTIGVIDCGGKTTNILVAKQMQEIPRRTNSINIGAWDGVRAMKIELEKIFPESDLRDHDVNHVIQTQTMRYFGKDIDISELCNSVINPIADQIIGQVTQLWGGAGDIDKVLITGGGANLFGVQMQAQFRHAVVVQDPVFSNVNGYYKFSNFNFGKE